MNRIILKPIFILGDLFPQIFIWWNRGFWRTRIKMLEQRDKNAREFLYIVCNSYMRKFGFFIGYTTSLRSEPILPHGFNGIYISGGASVGRGCIIFPNVIIGSNTLPDSKGQGAPQIGDNCYIGAGATIIGKVTIGNNCRIGANTTVSQDVPDNCVVISQEPRILQKSDLDNTWTPFTY